MPAVFALMGLSFIAAAIATLPIDAEPRSTVAVDDPMSHR